MACDLIKGHSVGCRDGVGGLVTLWFAQYDEATLTLSSGEVTDLQMGSAHLHGYHMNRGVGSISESITGSTENGTVFYTQTATLKFNKLSKEYQNELKLIAQQRLVIFAELNQLDDTGVRTVMCLGAHNGCQLTSGTNSSGTALGDMNGYEWVFEAQEPMPMYEVLPMTAVAFDQGAFTYAGKVVS